MAVSAGTETTCDYCGIKFERSRYKQQYCSISCANKHQYETGERDRDTTTDAANEAVREQGMQSFKENPTTKIWRGWTLIYIPAKHPELEQGWMPEHRFVWWKETGSLPPEDKVVHHKDEDKSNNDFDNLELVSRDEHAKIHNDEGVTVECEWCGKEFKVSPSEKERRRCCSQSCIAKLWSDER